MKLVVTLGTAIGSIENYFSHKSIVSFTCKHQCTGASSIQRNAESSTPGQNLNESCLVNPSEYYSMKYEWNEAFFHNFENEWVSGCLNIKMPSYQYRHSHYTDKAASRPSYLLNGNTTWKDRLYIETRPTSLNGGHFIQGLPTWKQTQYIPHT